MDKEGRMRMLVICTHNAVRSQIAEGLVNALFSERYVASSAGSRPSQVHPMAIKTMAELGIDISGHRSKHLSEFEGKEFEYVVMVCDSGMCPSFFGGKEYISHPFSDPSVVEGDDARMEAFRRTRDEILAWIRERFVGNGR